MINPRPLLLDSTVLLSYERDLTRRAQAFVVEAMTDGRILVVPALSLAVAAAELAGRNRELSWLVDDPEGPLQILPLSMNALDVARSLRKRDSWMLRISNWHTWCTKLVTSVPWY